MCDFCFFLKNLESFSKNFPNRMKLQNENESKYKQFVCMIDFVSGRVSNHIDNRVVLKRTNT